MAAVVLAAVVFIVSPTKAFTPPTSAPPADFDQRKPVRQARPVSPARQASIQKLKSLEPGIQIEFDELRGTPKRIVAGRGFLSGPNGEGKTVPPVRARQFGRQESHRAVKAFLDEHAGVFGHGAGILQDATVRRDFTARHNGLRTVVWEQQLDGITVDDGVLVGHESSQGELVMLSSLMIPEAATAGDRGTPNRRAAQAAPPITAEQAVRISAAQVGEFVQAGDPVSVEAAPAGPELRQSFRVGKLPGETKARLIWLPLDEDQLRLCWEVHITRRAGGERFRVVVDALSGDVLIRRQVTLYLTDAAYRVFTGDSPSPFSPGWPTPNSNQPPAVARSLVALSALNTNASPLGWISDFENETRGNNVDAHTDADGDDRPDLPRPQGSPFRVFDPPLDLEQAPSSSSAAAVVQLFYWCNWLHDRLYGLGFVEAAGNFQKDNLGRGGLGGDAVLADAQDGSGVNNANFTPTPDGESPRIQMFVWTGPNPDRDGDFDAEVVIHEYVHGLSTRLVGGGVGINTVQAAGMGEGWSDFYALALLSESSDDIDGVFPFGGYASHQLSGLAENYYFGIRRYPYTTDMGKNPLTLRDMDPLQTVPHDGVPRSPLSPFNPLNASEVHALGEIWCSVLWDARANLIRKHGYAAGNELMLQLVTDGMKLTPPNPNFLQARDGILLADRINNLGANNGELWAAFARRGMGFSARVPDSSTTAGVREFNDLPDALFIASPNGLFASGPRGGPFSPACITYPLTNLSDRAIRWAAAASEPWLQVSPFSGTLAPRTMTNVTICLTSNALDQPIGSYMDFVVFANLDSGVTQTRSAELRVMIFRGLPFVEGFETGEVEDYWSVTGTGRHRALVNKINSPHSGDYHLTLDADGGVQSRNELTLGLDLAGYTNVVLQFWAKTFGDEPDAPPPSPFVGGADFDGVAISEDGVKWYEVQSLRDLAPTYTELIVNLDAAAAAFGLRYSPSFRIRFNQFDDFQIPFDGIALDDIRITGTPARRFFVDAPARVVEGAGVMTHAGVVRLGLPVARAVTVTLTSSRPERAQVPSTVTIPAGADRVEFPLSVPENAFIDGTEVVTILASAPEYFSGSADVAVVDNESASLRVQLPPRATEGAGTLSRQATVRMDVRPERDVVVSLRSSLPGKLQVPSTTTVRAGDKSAAFDLNLPDDDRIDGPQTVIITAHVENWVDGSDAILVLDNDAPALTLELPPSVSEGNDIITNGAAVRLSGLLTTNLVVGLVSSDLSELQVPAEIVVPAGQIRAGFNLRVMDDGITDGRQTVSISAKAPRFASDSASLTVLDDEMPVTPYQPRPANGATNVPVALALGWGTGKGELLVNGDFETGDFTGWVNVNSGYGTWIVNDGKFDPDGPEGPTAPLSGLYSALTVQIGAGQHLLYQDFTVPMDVQSATLSWTDRIRNHAAYFSSPNQEYRVEIRDTNNVVLETVFRTSQNDTNIIPATRRTRDVSRYRGQTIRLAFYQQDNLGYLNVALDDVSVNLGAPEALTVFDVYFGSSARLTQADLRGTTTNGVWPLPTLPLRSTFFWQVVARRGATVARGPVWKFTTRDLGMVDHFDFGPIASPQYAGQRFAVTVTARDDINNAVKSFTGPVRLRGWLGRGTRSQVLITELDVGPNDQVEFANASDRTLDLSGWTISIYDVAAWPAPLTTFRVPAGVQCPPRAYFVLTDREDATGDFPIFKAGTNISWNASPLGNPIAVMVQDAAGGVVDFLAAGDANPSLIATPRRLPAQEWSGPAAAVAGIQNSGFTLRRFGEQDNDSAMDWEVAAGALGGANPNLKLPFARRGEIPVRPDVLTNFMTGVWVGYVTMDQAADPVSIEATDAAGHVGLSTSFVVGARDDVGVTVVDSPDVAILGDPLTYQLTVTNTGPTSAAGVILTNWFPSEVAFVSASTFHGTCSSAGQVVVCNLEDIPAGDSARVTLTVDAVRAGLVTNVATVGRQGMDGFAANNRSIAVTTITGPFLSTTNLALNEGSTSTNVAHFPVLLSAPCRYPVTVRYATSNMTAQAGSDFLGVAGTLVFDPGVTNLVIHVPIIPDRMDEGSEQFTLELFSPSNAVIVTPQGRCRIVDDDPPPMMTVDDVSVVEGGAGTETMIEFRFRLSAPSALGVQVNYATVDETAHAPLDYAAASGTLVFPAGMTNQSVRVAVRGDYRYEGDEKFFLQLGQVNAAILSRTQAVATILDDDVTEVDHFEWSEIASPQFAAFPFSGSLTARDGLGRVASGYHGEVALGAVTDRRDMEIGSGTNLWAVPFGTFFHDLRAQALYWPEELGPAASLNALAVDVVALPGQTLSNWTIRVKHSPLRNLAAAGWERDGWSTVYRSDETIVEPGWTVFFFDAPFLYNGVDALMVDFSFNNGRYSVDGLVRSTIKREARTLHLQTDSAFGDPLTWTGMNPPPTASLRLPNTRFQFERPLRTTPVEPVKFAAGLWAGPIRVLDAASNVVLRANDGQGRLATSDPFDVLPGSDSDGDGVPDAWQLAHFGSLGLPEARGSADPDGDGWTNLEEFRAGSDPRLGSSVVAIHGLERREDGLWIRFGTQLGRRYWIEARDLASVAGWQLVEGVAPVVGQGGEATVRLADQPAQSGRFYRVRIEP